MISNGSMERSTPPATATSRSPSSSALHAVATDSSEDEQAPSTVYPPPLRSKWLQMRPAMVLDSPPASVSSSTAGNGFLYVASKSSRNEASASSSQSCSL